MNFYQMIEDMKEYLRRDKLVIFVGAGVSKNSGVPTWGRMVRTFAEQMDYPVEKLSTDEYIRIPQYYYGMDESEGHRDYYETIRKIISPETEPNILNELIAQLHPKHIVTTNYDKLMDKVAEGYEVIRQDKDLLKVDSNNYLIKMHGDIDDIEHIVFKEDDYLRYSHTHSLIELYIKSLLIDHTFLFVGYSLNDYNLKTFLSWIDYLGHEKKVKENMHANYLITNDIFPNQDYLISYYEQKNIQVINLNNLDERLINESKKVPLEEEIGRKTYICLKHLKQG